MSIDNIPPVGKQRRLIGKALQPCISAVSSVLHFQGKGHLQSRYNTGNTLNSEVSTACSSQACCSLTRLRLSPEPESVFRDQTGEKQNLVPTSVPIDTGALCILNHGTHYQNAEGAVVQRTGIEAKTLKYAKNIKRHRLKR